MQSVPRMHLCRQSICEVEMQCIVIIILHRHRFTSKMFFFCHVHCVSVSTIHLLDACALTMPRVVPPPSHQNHAFLVMRMMMIHVIYMHGVRRCTMYVYAQRPMCMHNATYASAVHFQTIEVYMSDYHSLYITNDAITYAFGKVIYNQFHQSSAATTQVL
jgi:hypothetical protein